MWACPSPEVDNCRENENGSVGVVLLSRGHRQVAGAARLVTWRGMYAAEAHGVAARLLPPPRAYMPPT